MHLACSWEFSLRNQLLARAAFLFLTGTRKEELPEGLRTFLAQEDSLENRGEVLRERGEWIFYGSHNVDGMRNLIQFLMCGNYNLKTPPFDAVLVAFSRRESRDIRAMLKMLKGSGLGKVFVTTFAHPKAVRPESMENLAGLEGIKFVHDLEAHIKNSDHTCRTLVTGSYYFLGHIKSLLRSR
jgi:folylpolyglutamate synthase/dihydropteroate synthase